MSSQKKTSEDLKKSGLKWNAKKEMYVREGDKPLNKVLSHIQQQGVAQYHSALARQAWYVDTDGTNEAGWSPAPMNDNGRGATTSAGMIRQVELDAKMNLLRHLWDVYTTTAPTAIDSQATDNALRSGASSSSSPSLIFHVSGRRSIELSIANHLFHRHVGRGCVSARNLRPLRLGLRHAFHLVKAQRGVPDGDRREHTRALVVAALDQLRALDPELESARRVLLPDAWADHELHLVALAQRLPRNTATRASRST